MRISCRFVIYKWSHVHRLDACIGLSSWTPIVDLQLSYTPEWADLLYAPAVAEDIAEASDVVGAADIDAANIDVDEARWSTEAGWTWANVDEARWSTEAEALSGPFKLKGGRPTKSLDWRKRKRDTGRDLVKIYDTWSEEDTWRIRSCLAETFSRTKW